jgi:hypothetical protein
LDVDDSVFSFRLLMSNCMSFIILTTSARVGSPMVMDAADAVGDEVGEGGAVGLAVAGAEEED